MKQKDGIVQIALGGVISGILDLIFWLICPFLCMFCFVLFDLFHLKETWQQVMFVLLPFPLPIYLMWQREKEQYKKSYQELVAWKNKKSGGSCELVVPENHETNLK